MSGTPPNSDRDLSLRVLKTPVLLLHISLCLFLYERLLIPIYGSVPSTYLLDKIVFVVTLAAAFQPYLISPSVNALAAGVVLALQPNVSYHVAVWTARKGNPVWGPTITHALAIAPLIFVMVSAAVGNFVISPSKEKNSAVKGYQAELRGTASVICYFGATRLSKLLWPRVTYLNEISDSQIFVVLSTFAFMESILELQLSSSTTKKSGKTNKSKPKPKSTLSSFTPIQIKSALLTVYLGAWYALYPRLYSPVLPHPLPQTYTHPSFPMQVHSSVQSTTGLILVGEALPPPGYAEGNGNENDMHSVRYLRAAHSILGGVWMQSKVNSIDDVPPVQDSFGTPLGDSIYGVFVLQEAARLVDSTETGKIGGWKNALIIGLGAGTSATAFHRHNIDLTVVEIDPAVYDAARQFFGFPTLDPAKVFLEDARAWAADKRTSLEAGKEETLYDIVVHDCFSGGGVPQQLYTVQFWNDLKAVIHPEGVAVINFVGRVQSESSRMVLYTLEKTFGSCRAFHDHMEELTEDKYADEFLNIVFFCTPSSAPLTFRSTGRADYLGSPLRRHVLAGLSGREVNLKAVRATQDNPKLLLTDSNNPLGKLQEEQGHYHWKLMRQVLPDIYWETF